MSLLDRIQQDHDAQVSEQTTEEIKLVQAQEAQTLLLAEIIRSSLQRLAIELDEELEVVKPGKIFRLGDLVLYVQLFGTSKKDLPDPSQAKLVTSEYAVNLLGIDTLTGTLVTSRIGMLMLLSYDSLSAAVIKAKDELELKAAMVLVDEEQLKRL